MFVFAAFFAGSLVLTVADAVPVLDVKKSCQGAEITAVFAGRNLETCVLSFHARWRTLMGRNGTN